MSVDAIVMIAVGGDFVIWAVFQVPWHVDRVRRTSRVDEPRARFESLTTSQPFVAFRIAIAVIGVLLIVVGASAVG